MPRAKGFKRSKLEGIEREKLHWRPVGATRSYNGHAGRVVLAVVSKGQKGRILIGNLETPDTGGIPIHRDRLPAPRRMLTAFLFQLRVCRGLRNSPSSSASLFIKGQSVCVLQSDLTGVLIGRYMRLSHFTFSHGGGRSCFGPLVYPFRGCQRQTARYSALAPAFARH
jgi:hypothetical protein